MLNGELGKVNYGNFATIIQHPGGSDKKIAIRKNEITNLEMPDVVIDVSDTALGSSGAPVFNDEWQVIALYSAGVAKKNAAGQYMDKDGQVIEPVNDQSTRSGWSGRATGASGSARSWPTCAPPLPWRPTR